MASTRRLTIGQVLRLVEGAELIASGCGLSVLEILTVILAEPSKEQRDEAEEEEPGEDLVGRGVERRGAARHSLARSGAEQPV